MEVLMRWDLSYLRQNRTMFGGEHAHACKNILNVLLVHAGPRDVPHCYSGKVSRKLFIDSVQPRAHFF